MNMKSDATAPSGAATGFDWREFASATCTKVDWTTVAQRALGSATLAMLVGGAVAVIGRAIAADLQAQRAAAAARAADEANIVDAEYEVISDTEVAGREPTVSDAADPEAMPAPAVDPDVAAAAALLGVAVDATADEVRAALRSALSASRLHPDQGGDGEAAKRLIAAKNLLVERSRTATT